MRSAGDPRLRLGLFLFAATILCSAFLLFLVQPMVGKRILPWFGGVPAVWALCLAFFQTTLFAGYTYAHCLIRYATPNRQLAIHAVVCATALASLPVLPGDAWKPLGAVEPTGAILAMLAAHVAAPFGVLAATGPLVQAWFARAFPGRSPYPLYAVSNLGSLLALLGYPVLIEPNLRLSTTGIAWSSAFVATALAVIGCAALARRSRSGEDAAGEVDPAAPAPGAGRRALWVLLAGCGVVLLMGVTNELCLDIASVPFLWILPLATYLATLILCFGTSRLYWRPAYVALVALAYFSPAIAEVAAPIAELPPVWSVEFQAVRYCVLLFGACMVLHGEVYRLRPPTRWLTSYYLCISGGGALGGILVGLVAPHTLDAYYELDIGLVAAAALLLAVCWNDPRSWLRRGSLYWPWRWAAVGALGAAVLWVERPRDDGIGRDLIYHERTFFGVLRVLELDNNRVKQRQLLNGTTLHGLQFVQNDKIPTSYYGRQTGIGLALDLRPSDVPSSIGVIGLGAGTLAAYGRPGDRIRFYEIDRAVIRLARDTSLFTFLGGSAAEIEVAEGDARISLAADRAHQLPLFDYLIVDAYSSDAVPVHLLTREALDLYVDSIEQNGFLAMHVSNRFFRLEPLLARFARDAGLGVIAIRNPPLPRAQSGASVWVFLSRNEDGLRELKRLAEKRSRVFSRSPGIYQVWRPKQSEVDRAPLWTDDFSNLLGVLDTPHVRHPFDPTDR